MQKFDFNSTRFNRSASDVAQLETDSGAEIAFIGRSNAGKSSVLNTLCNNKNLARTSKTPGRTQLINVFDIYPDYRLVDLPGYGFAKVTKAQQRSWEIMLQNYFCDRKSLLGLVIVLDIRHLLKPTDEQMLLWALENQLNVHLLLNKADKLSNNGKNQAIAKLKQSLDSNDFISHQCFSALKKQGVEQLATVLKAWFDV